MSRDGSLYHLGLKWDCLTHYSDKDYPYCVQCGELNLLRLQLDHINNDGEEQRQIYSRGRGSKDYYQSLRNRGYPNDSPLQVLCGSCNMKKPRRGKAKFTATLPGGVVFTAEFDYENPIPDVSQSSLWREEE